MVFFKFGYFEKNIMEINHPYSNKVYGYKRIHVFLKRQGINVGVKRVWRLMKAIQAQSIMQRRFRKPVTQVLYAP
ncbi:IS3 family transposase [Leuconostoc mesenteroides]|uniref:IS3 family transposase n=1 Tax=Leuconostoc mesenteroides TaxID=1245 RepID=UPI003C4ED79F